MKRTAALLAALTMAGCGGGMDEELATDWQSLVVAVPGRIQAEAFDQGADGDTHHDTTPANLGGELRPNSSVDLETCLDTGAGHNVGWIEAGEWLEYTVSVAQTARFKFTARVSSGYEGTKSFHLTLDGAALPKVSFSDASGWQTWRSVVAGEAQLAAGTHKVRLYADTAKFNFNHLDVAEVALACVPTTCAGANAECGSLSDGCGGTLSCGTCPTGQCQANHCALPPPGDFQMIFGAATTNNLSEFNALDQAWGPIRMTREYDSGGGFKPVDQYAWYEFAKNNFDYIAFSADERKTTASYREVANGVHDAKIRAMVDSVRTRLAGKRGVILLGNEPNTEPVDPATYRDALEHVIDVFGYEPAPNFIWGVAFSNYNVWGGGRDDGKAWLPRRNDGPFMVETHFYGRDEYPDPAGALGRTLIPEMRNHPKWLWGIGELSAVEDPGHTKKAAWFTEVSNYCANNGAAYFLVFDTGVGGSAPIGTSENTRRAVEAIATKFQSSEWPDF